MTKRIIEQTELDEILKAHKLWLNHIKGGKQANLSWANLRGANLSWADLSGANLRWADLSWASLRGADLSGANLRGADLRGANLSGANLSGASLRGADLSGANLSGANLSGADLISADLATLSLKQADMRGKNLDFCKISLSCGNLQWKIDRKLAVQFLYHFCSYDCEDAEIKAAQNNLISLANEFHRVDECGKITKKI